MSKQNFQNLKELIGSLKKEEQTLARKHLTAFESYHTQSPNKMLRVYKTILKHPDIEYLQLKKKAAGKNTLKSYNQLINRTKERILESLILDINLLRNELYSLVFQKRFKIRKLIIQAYILQGRGLTNIALSKFNWIEKTAKKFELYDELIETLYYKQAILFNRQGRKAFEKIGQEIAFYELCRSKLLETKDIYRDYFADVNFKIRGSGKEEEYLKSKSFVIGEFYNDTNSANIAMYKFLIDIEVASIKKDYDEGLKLGLKFIEKLKSNKAIYSKPRIGYYYFTLAENEIFALRFKSAINYSNQAVSYFQNSQTINYLFSAEYWFIGHYYSQNLKDCILILKEIESSEIINKYPIHKSKLFYQKALCYFAMDQFRDANVLLNNMPEIEKDKEGWNVWIRIMRILCSIELMRLNMIDYDVESFRKYMQRLGKQKDIRPRDKLVLKMLLELDRSNYDFKLAAEKRPELLAQLSSVEEGISWEPKSPELILFHDWFKSKMENRPYKPDFEPYRLELARRAAEREKKNEKPLAEEQSAMKPTEEETKKPPKSTNSKPKTAPAKTSVPGGEAQQQVSQLSIDF
jgi:hypothetical protein